MYVVKINTTHTMGIPLQILNVIKGDFDGDVLNIRYIINKEFLEGAIKIYNPRNAMFISRNNGMFNNDMNHFDDTIINLNTFVRLGRDSYTPEMLDKINSLKKV